MNRRWICNDVWMDILPCFDHAQLGLKLALLSPRFNSLVDKHFNGKNELTIWRPIEISKGIGPEPKLSVEMDDNFVPFPLPKFPSSHSTDDEQPIWEIFVRELWPIFSANIRHLGFIDGDHLDNLLRLIAPTILTDLNQLVSIHSFDLLPGAIGDDFDGPNATDGQVLSKWLHSPRKDGQPKRLCCKDFNEQVDTDWINNFKEAFLRANAISSVSYEIHFSVYAPSIPMMPFELVNEWTKEKLTLTKAKENKLEGNCWMMKRCKIIGETSAVQQHKEGDCNNLFIWFDSDTNCIGPLSPPPEEEDEEEAGQSITNGQSSADK